MEQGYRDDLAYVHDAGFGQLAASAAHMLVGELRSAGIHSGVVVDLGCGSGVTARFLCDAGYDVVGIDLSEALIGMARQRVPEASFRVASFATADIPACVAVTAIGEVFNYTFDAANSPAVRAGAFGRIHAALAEGGLFMFDVAGHARAPSSGPQRTFTEGADWAVLMQADSDPAQGFLTRRITTFRRLGELYRRDAEIHRLQLVDPAEILTLLHRSGFAARTSAHYGSLALPHGLVAFLASKGCRTRGGPARRGDAPIHNSSEGEPA